MLAVEGDDGRRLALGLAPEGADGVTVSELYATLFPAGPEGQMPVAYARNQSAVDGDAVLSDGDEVAFLPPLGGG